MNRTEREIAKLMVEYGPKWGFDVPDAVKAMAQGQVGPEPPVDDLEATVDVCTRCGAMIGDIAVHRKWHAATRWPR